MLDLTPFGFTSTESLLYAALLEQGTSSGYALAKSVTLARANVYQGLNGLVAKGAAVVAQEESPRLFRAVSPKALLAQVALAQAESLERLDQQVRAHRATGAERILNIRGRRAFEQLALRTAARTAGLVQAVATADLLSTLLPLWRKRAADGTPSGLWTVGDRDVRLPLELQGRVEPDALDARFRPPFALLTTPEAGILVSTPAVEGHWSSDPIIVATMAAAISHIIADASGS